MPWQISLVIFWVFYALQALWMRRYAKQTKLPGTWPSAIAYLLGVMPLSILIGFLSNHLHIVWNRTSILLIIAQGLLIGIFNIFQFIAVREISIVRFRTIFQLNEVIVIILGWSLLGEGLNLYQSFGAATLLVAALLAIHAPSHKGAIKISTKAWIMTVLAVVFLGTGQVVEKAALRYMDYGMYFIVGFAAQSLALILVAMFELSRTNLRTVTRHDLRQATIMGILIVPIGTSYIFALQKTNNVSLMAALTAFALPITALASHFLLGEKENKLYMWSAVGLGCTGLILTAF